MTTQTPPLSEITREAVAVLVRELGIAHTLRFLRQFRIGQNDYTAERHTFLIDPPIEDLVREAQRLDEEKNA